MALNPVVKDNLLTSKSTIFMTTLSFDDQDTVSSVQYSELTFSAPFSDPTGQIKPPWIEFYKPFTRHPLQATLWEEEGTLLFHVHLNNIEVSRREDNHMVNGTTLLKAAGWTSERANMLLEMERIKHVVDLQDQKLEHLSGTWIPFNRALEVANEVGVVERLYPLFVYNAGALLYRPCLAGPDGSTNL